LILIHGYYSDLQIIIILNVCVLFIYFVKTLMEELLRVLLCTWNNHVDYEKWWRNSLEIKRFIIELGLSNCFT